MDIKDLIVVAEEVETGEKVIGYVCGCPDCSKPYDSFNGDITRPQAMLTGFDGTYGNIKVYADTLENTLMVN